METCLGIFRRVWRRVWVYVNVFRDVLKLFFELFVLLSSLYVLGTSTTYPGRHVVGSRGSQTRDHTWAI